jgi:hypothetical protein
MADKIHPAASHHLPPFIVGPGETDILMTVMAVVLIAAVLLVGVLYFRLHALPEQLAHRSHKLQLEIVAVLGLLALFTHEHLFWIAGLLLALIDFPDFGGLLGRIARSLERMAGIKSDDEAAREAAHPASESVGVMPASAESQPDYEPVKAEGPAAAEEVAPVAELRTGSTRG